MPGEGQPTKLTPQRARLILERISNGVSETRSCASAGISKQTHYNWLARGEAEKARLEANPRARPREREAPFVDYFDRVQKAREEAYVRCLAVVQASAVGGREIDSQIVEELNPDGSVKSRRRITRIAQPQWQAAAWFLERRYPDEFARTYKGEVTGKSGGPIEFTEMTKEEYQAFLRENMSRASQLADVFLDEDDLV